MFNLKKIRTLGLPKNLDERMKKFKKYVISSFFVLSLSTIAAFLFCSTVLAIDTTTELINPIKATTTIALIEITTNYLMRIAIVLAPMMIIIAAFTFLTAGGNERKVATAKKMLLWAIIGLTLVLVSKGIISLLKDFLMPVT